MPDNPDDALLLDLTAQIVSAHMGHNPVSVDALPPLIVGVLRTLKEAGSWKDAAKRDPAVPINKSVFLDHIVCLECGASFKTLKRHIETEHDLTPEEYRQRFSLGHLYPLVAPDYATRRSALAKELRLGRNPRAAVAVESATKAKRTTNSARKKADSRKTA